MNDNKAWINIKKLREFYGETQEELAKVMGVSKNTVQNWEYGLSDPKAEHISILARHYHTTETSLLYGDYTDLQKKGGMGKMSFEQALKNVRICFPLFYPKEHETDDLFIKAYSLHKQLLDASDKYSLLSLRNKSIPTEIQEEYDTAVDSINTIMDLYENSYDMYKNDYALVNFCMLLFKVGMYMRMNYLENQIDEKTVYKYENNENVMKELILRHYFSSNKHQYEILGMSKDEWREWTENTDEIIKELKSQEKWADIAEYFICLKYMCNFCNNEFDEHTNFIIGNELLKTYVKLGNRFIQSRLRSLSQWQFK